MLPFDLGAGGTERWFSVTIQLTILAITSTFLLGGEIVNSYIFVSFMLVVALFCLQAVNRRFLFLNPVNQFTKERTVAADTYTLVILILLSSLSLFFGAFLGPPEHELVDAGGVRSFLKCLDSILLAKIPCLAIFSIVILPTVFWGLKKTIAKGIANKLKGEGDGKWYKFYDNCPKCCYRLAIFETKVESQDKGKLKVSCRICGLSVEEEDVNLEIGY